MHGGFYEMALKMSANMIQGSLIQCLLEKKTIRELGPFFTKMELN